MKKSAILAAALVLATSSAYAYENSYAGYSVKDGNPYVRVETNKVYAFSNAQSTDMAKIYKDVAKDAKKKNLSFSSLDKYQGASSVNYYTAQEMQEILGEDFSTAYFEAEYDKLALLERSQLNLKTVPTPLLDLERYNAFENKGNVMVQNQLLKKKIDQLKPNIKLEKIAGKKAITISYLYKQMNRLVNVDVTLLSANDRLYILTNMGLDSALYAAKAESKEDKADEVKAKAKLKDAMEQALNIENVDAATVPAATMNKLTKQRLNLVKGVTFFAPTHAAKPLTFTDATIGKKIELPEDWYYTQIKYQIGAKTNATITGAGSVPEMQAAANAMDVDGILSTVVDNFDKMDSESTEANKAAFDNVGAKYLEEFSKAMQYINSSFVTTSFKVEDESLKEMLATPVSNQLTVNLMLRDGLKRLHGFANENFALHDYSYKLDFTREKANINIDADFMALKDYNFNSKLFLGCKNDIASVMFFVKKDGFTPNSLLVDQINKWQF